MESSKYQTFFDLGVDEENKKPFATLMVINYTNKKKKRVINNELVKKYFNNEELTKNELIMVRKILDGSIYEERRQLYEHCKLCSPDFERIPLLSYSSKYKYWEICIPTFPYFPGGLMIYLKERNIQRIENIQNLPDDYLKELIQIQEELLIYLRRGYLGESLVGVNILFNQLSKSELCIHGHIELMIKDIDEKDYNCKYVIDRPYDKFTQILNSRFPDDSSIQKMLEGIKINYDSLRTVEVKNYMKLYEKNILYYFNRGKQLQNKLINADSEIDNTLINNMIPAAVNFVYLTFYRGKHMISMVPSITSSFVPLADISNDPIEIYSLMTNRNYSNKDNVFMKNYSPLIRPSIKVYTENNNDSGIKKLQKIIYKELENDNT